MSDLIPVAEALARILASVPAPVECETVPLAVAAGRTLAVDLTALRTQPPFPASAMDGYAVRSPDAAAAGASLKLVGTSAAGHGFVGTIGPGETVRIFTGAPVPEGADAILIQENADAAEEAIRVLEPVAPEKFIRRAGLDFSAGDALMAAGDPLDARRLALIAAAGHGRVAVRRKPRVAILATGDELVPPGETPAWDQIVASNTLALAALVNAAGAEAIDLGIAGDTLPALEAAFGLARAARADLLVTLGGASVGDHDLVQTALAREGLKLGFWRVALRPGKPLMHGHLGEMLVIGLPGNPVSSIVCGLLFVVPAIRALLGDPGAGADRSEPATLGRDLDANDGRQDYMRASLDTAPDRLPVAHPESRQDSSMLAVLGRAEALLIREPHAPAAAAGDPCPDPPPRPGPALNAHPGAWTMDFHCDHLHLRSRDAVAAAGFYVAMLGAREIRREGAPAVSRVVLDLGGLRVFIEQAPEGTVPTAQAPHLGIEHVGLGVADLDATLASLHERGVRVLVDAKAMRPGLRVAFIAGPDDVRIELLERRDAA